MWMDEMLFLIIFKNYYTFFIKNSTGSISSSLWKVPEGSVPPNPILLSKSYSYRISEYFYTLQKYIFPSY